MTAILIATKINVPADATRTTDFKKGRFIE
jgi:hypothetical protein